MEIYKDILGFNNYQVSNIGNIKNKTAGKILKPQLSTNGHYIITLFNEEIVKGKSFQIHQLVAKAFLEMPNECVNHKDGNKLNNRVDNLEWVTFSQNLKHAHKTGLRSKVHSKNKNNTSGKVGVLFDKHKDRWIARLHKNGKSLHLGTFKNKEDAIKAREEAEKNIEEYK